MLRITGIVLACLFFALPAEARQRAAACVETGTVMAPRCMGQSNNPFSGARSIKVTMKRERQGRGKVGHNEPVRIAAPVRDTPRVAETVVEHPAGCPHVAFCACGAGLRIFGSLHPFPGSWLAAEWAKRFPRTSPAPGMVAVRSHHVMVLEADLGGGVWQVYDANSGRHLTRVHARSIAGYAVVNPRA